MRRIAVSFTALAALLAVAACSDQAQQTGGATGSGSTMNNNGAIARPSAGGVMTEAERLAQMQREFQTSVGDRVYYGTDSFSLSADAKAVLDRQAAFLRQYPQVMLRIEGHADERGTREYNLALGDRRAQAAKEFLLSQGVSSGRLTTSTLGKERPEAIGSNEQAWAQNRRAVSIIAQQYSHTRKRGPVPSWFRAFLSVPGSKAGGLLRPVLHPFPHQHADQHGQRKP